MHGRKRQTEPLSVEQQAVTKKKLDMYRNLLEVALKSVSSIILRFFGSTTKKGEG